MASSSWDWERFWTQKESIVRMVARRRGHHDPRDAMSYIWEKLRDSSPNASGDGLGDQDLDRKIFVFSHNCFNNENRRRHRWARRMVALDDPAVHQALTSERDDIEAFTNRDRVDRVLQRRS